MAELEQQAEEDEDRAREGGEVRGVGDRLVLFGSRSGPGQTPPQTERGERGRQRARG